MQLYRLSCNTPSKLIIFQSKKILFSKMVSSKLRLTDQFSDASTEHTCSFIFYWLAQFVMLGPILEQDVRKRSLNWYWGKLIFHTIGIKHCISNFINSKIDKKNLKSVRGRDGVVKRRSLNSIVKRRIQMTKSNGVSNGILKWCIQMAQSNCAVTAQ